MSSFSVKQNFVEYQYNMLNCLPYMAVTRYKIEKTKTGFVITSPSLLAQLCFYITLANSLAKFIYIAYLLHSQYRTLDFLDKISALLYLLIFGIMTIAYTVWWLKYPLFEILYRSWTIQQKIFQKLGSPRNLRRAVNTQQRITIWAHFAICWIGCCCFLIQFYADPKYCTFTYAFIYLDNWVLRIIFAAHEFLYMLHAWHLMTSSNCLFGFHGIVLSNLLDGLTDALNELQANQWKPFLKRNSTTKACEYQNVDEILDDYKKLLVITELYNEWVSYKTVFLHACGYCQFIADVFLAVQVLRLPHTGVMDIWFYIEDSMASMYMIYRVYNTMSQVEPASRGLFETLNRYLIKSRSPDRKRLVRYIRTLKLVSLKIGPCPVTQATVLSAMEILGNYYICVALWK